MENPDGNLKVVQKIKQIIKYNKIYIEYQKK